jgi:hypothetical protein
MEPDPDMPYKAFENAKNLALDVMEKARVFCFETNDPVMIEPNDKPLDLPFVTCSFERLNAPMAIMHQGGEAKYVFCIVVHEKAINDYVFVTMMAKKIDPYDLYDFRHGPMECDVVEKKDTESYKRMQALVAEKLGNMNSPDNVVGNEDCKERIKMGSGSNKRVRVIKNITHIVPKKETKNAKSATGREIDWSQRYEVRGHWRILLTETRVGKNREGERVVLGYTWVDSFVKGPEDKPLVKKTRVVKKGDK